jgi:CheY-like chemotaxis protein
LEIGDSGKGMSVDPNMPGPPSGAILGVGIQGMRERLRQLSGTLEITSEPNQGTLVTAILPFRCQCEDISESDQFTVDRESRPAPHADAPETTGWRKRILIADDHDVLRRGIKTMIESEPNLEVCGEAVDGKDAIEKIINQAPDLVILDINMPILNGLDVVRQVVCLRPQTKILAFSVHDSPQIVEEIIAAGAHGYLSKATAGQSLVNKVNLLLDEEIHAQPA